MLRQVPLPPCDKLPRAYAAREIKPTFILICYFTRSPRCSSSRTSSRHSARATSLQRAVRVRFPRLFVPFFRRRHGTWHRSTNSWGSQWEISARLSAAAERSPAARAARPPVRGPPGPAGRTQDAADPTCRNQYFELLVVGLAAMHDRVPVTSLGRGDFLADEVAGLEIVVQEPQPGVAALGHGGIFQRMRRERLGHAARRPEPFAHRRRPAHRAPTTGRRSISINSAMAGA